MATARYLKLLLIRHAQSLGNCEGIMEGQSSTELSELGHQQAHQLSTHLLQDHRRDYLRDHLGAIAPPTPEGKAIEKITAPVSPLHLYSSPLQRAAQTTQHLASGLQQKQQPFQLYSTQALKEMHQGILQGLTWAQAQEMHPHICTQLLSTTQWQPVPEAESLITARGRAQSWVKHILTKHQPGDTLWAVSHEGFLQHLISVVMGCDRTWKISIAHTAIFEFWLADTSPARHPIAPTDRFNPEYWIVRRFNDCSHLHSS